jgi:DNA-binding GntR family transcriptional regulator
MSMSTVERVEQRLRQGLLRGDYAPGAWLRQDDLATELGVSKIPVREALQRLAAASLVTFEPNRGALVRPLTAGDAEEIFALRQAIEPKLLRRAVGRHTTVDLATAELALRSDSLPITEANWLFHRALYLAAGAGHRRNAARGGGSLRAALHREPGRCRPLRCGAP